MNVLNRAGYFRRHVVSGELTYDWATSAKHRHSFSPLVLSYEFMNSRTAAFDEAISESPYLQIAMRDQFVPKMSYTYTYTSPAKYRHPIIWSTLSARQATSCRWVISVQVRSGTTRTKSCSVILIPSS